MSETPDKGRKAKDLVHLKVRFFEETRLKLEAAAKANKTSMNAELINRLERSFEVGDVLDDPSSIALFRALNDAISQVEVVTGGHWQSDRVSYVAVTCLVDALLKDRQPPPINAAELIEVGGAITKIQNKIDGLLEMLEEVGAIKRFGFMSIIGDEASPRRRARGLLSPAMLSASSDESRTIVRMLDDLGCEPKINLDDPIENWNLVEGNGIDAAGAQSLFRQVPRLINEQMRLREAFLEALRPDDEAQTKGRDLADAIRNKLSYFGAREHHS